MKTYTYPTENFGDTPWLIPNNLYFYQAHRKEDDHFFFGQALPAQRNHEELLIICGVILTKRESESY